MERYGEEGTNMYHSSFIITYFIESISTIFNLLFLSVIIVHYPSQEISWQTSNAIVMSLTDYLPAEAPTSHSPHGDRRVHRVRHAPSWASVAPVAVAVAALMWAARIAASNAWRKPRKHSGNTPLPSVCIYTPRASYTFPAVGPVGGTGGQGRRRKEVSSRFIDYDFWLSADMGGTCFAPAQNNIWQTPKMYSFGGWAATMKYQLMAS